MSEPEYQASVLVPSVPTGERNKGNPVLRPLSREDLLWLIALELRAARVHSGTDADRAWREVMGHGHVDG